MQYNLIQLILSLGIILFACELFTNGIECLGKKLKVGDGVVGNLLSAVGTCLPETMIPIIAIIFSNGNDNAVDICIGAIVGAPFMLGTLALFVTGLSVLVFWNNRKTGTKIHVKIKILQRDLLFFMCIYSIGILSTFMPYGTPRLAVAGILIISYVFYITQTIKNDNVSLEKVNELYFLKNNGSKWNYSNSRKENTHNVAMVAQLITSMAAIILGSKIFINNIQIISSTIGISTSVLSLIIAPIATELPEKFNSFVWIRRKKDTLALGNITGAMVFQSCIPVAFGILSTPWNLDKKTLLSAILVLTSILVTYLQLKIFKKLMVLTLLICGFFYFSFIALVLCGVI